MSTRLTGVIITDTIGSFRSRNIGRYSLETVRHPADALFYADLTLNNVVIGSRYRVTRDSDGSELATGIASSSTVTISDISAYSNPMLMKIIIRKASGSPYYKEFKTYANLIRGGVSAYILQELDE